MDARAQFDISVIVPVGERQTDAKTLYDSYKAGVALTGLRAEFIYVIDGQFAPYAATLEKLAAAGEPITIILLTRTFGEATAVSAGFEKATAEIIVTLPAYAQVEASGIKLLVDRLGTVDLAVARRWPRVGGLFERFRRAVFHGLLSRVTKLQFRDLGCSARAMKRIVLEEIKLYGDQQRFLPVLADRQGFKVAEVDVPQHAADRNTGIYGPREYTRGFLDIFTVFFIVRFTKKPLRFFGMIGVVTFTLGVLAQLLMIVQRMFFDHALADRPAFLLASLFVVLGLQIFALGLLGELIIFVHAGGTKDYQVDRVIQFPRHASDVTTLPRDLTASR